MRENVAAGGMTYKRGRGWKIRAKADGCELPEYEVHRPAAAYTRPGRAEVGEQIGVGAAGLLEGVGQDGGPGRFQMAGRVPTE
jgi:hypothetical protein